MNPNKYRKDIERKILEIIEIKLKSGEMTPSRAKEIAQYILHLLHPSLSLDEIYIKVQDFDIHFPELIPAKLAFINDYDEKIKQLVANQVQKLMQEKRVNEADTLLRKAIDKQIKLGM